MEFPGWVLERMQTKRDADTLVTKKTGFKIKTVVKV
jgi:hypothetical protein